MSLISWKKEFYPRSAGLFKRRSLRKEAAAASLLKWEGMLQKNLKKHQLTLVTNDGNSYLASESEVDQFQPSAENCSLCVAFLSLYSGCVNCPIALSGGLSCGENGSAWFLFTEYDEVGPMIRTLRRAVAFQEQQEKTK